MRRILTLGSLAVFAACGQLLSESNDDEPIAPPPGGDGGGSDTGSNVDASAEDGSKRSDASSQQDSGPSCTTSVTPVVAFEDTVGLECAGTITYGGSAFLHVGLLDSNSGLLSKMFAKFKIPAPVKTALDADRVKSVRLLLTEDNTQGVNKSGQLAVHVLRNDWVAGTTTGPRDGADLCRRSAGDPGLGWGTASVGAPSYATRITAGVDYGGSIAAQAYAIADTQVTLQLFTKGLVDDWKIRAPVGGDLSLMVEELDNGGFNVASANATQFKKPTLEFEICE